MREEDIAPCVRVWKELFAGVQPAPGFLDGTRDYRGSTSGSCAGNGNPNCTRLRVNGDPRGK